MRVGVGTWERTKASPDECHVRPCRTYPSGPLTPAVGFLTRNRSRVALSTSPSGIVCLLLDMEEENSAEVYRGHPSSLTKVRSFLAFSHPLTRAFKVHRRGRGRDAFEFPFHPVHQYVRCVRTAASITSIGYRAIAVECVVSMSVSHGHGRWGR